MNDQGNKLTVGEMVYTITGDMKNLEVELKKAEAEISTLKNSITQSDKALNQLNKTGDTVKKVFAGIGGLFAANEIVGFLKSARQEAIEYQFQQVKLAQTLRTTTNASDEQIQSLVTQANELERLGALNRDVAVSVQAQLATFDLQVSSIKELTPALLDYIAAEKGLNASMAEGQAIANGFAQALQGNFASLTSTGFVLDEETKKLIKYGTEAERTAALVEVLNSTYQGFNAELKTQVSDGLEEWRAIMGDIRREIGERVINALRAIAPALTQATKFVKENLEDLLGYIEAFFKAIAVYVAASKLGGWITGVTSALGLFNKAVIAGTGWIGLKIKALILYEAAMYRARTAAIALQAAIGVIAAVATAAAVLIQKAADKTAKAWEDAAEAEIKASDTALQLIKVNQERKRIAASSASEEIKEIAEAEYQYAAALARNLTGVEMEEIVKRRDAARNAIRENSKLTEEWAKINTQAYDKVIPKGEEAAGVTQTNTEELDKMKRAAEKAKNELESFQGSMIGFINESKKVKESLNQDLAKSFDDFGKSLTENVSSTVSSMAQLVIGAETSIKDLKKQINETDDVEQRDALRKQLKEQEEILKSRRNYEERQAERITAIREKLEAAGIDAAQAGFDKLLDIRSLEEQIEEERRLASLNEFERFEEEQAKKLLVLTDTFISEVTLTKEKIATQEQYEADLTDYLLQQENKRLSNTDAWAQETIAKYAEVANSLKGLMSLQAQMGEFKQSLIPTAPSVPTAQVTQPPQAGNTSNVNNTTLNTTINGHGIQNFTLDEINAMLGFEYNKVQR